MLLLLNDIIKCLQHSRRFPFRVDYLRKVQLFVIIKDQMAQVKKITRDANFFEPARFKPFKADMGCLKIPIKSEAIQELYLKCYGYGYFEEEGKSMQTELKENFLIYIESALKECTKLKILKIEFCGFSIADRILIKVISQLQQLIQKRDIEILWFHTRLLKDCEPERINQILSLADRLISKNRVQEISLQISGWEFRNGPPSYWDMLGRFKNFADNLMEMGDQNIKRLKLDLSSLYVSQLQAYNFLKDAILTNQLIERIENAKFSQERKQNPVPESQLAGWRDRIKRYLNNIDIKFQKEHPIPGKSLYISREPEFQKRKKDYILRLMRNNVSKEDLLKVFHEERGMPEQHKVALKRMRQDVDREMEEQAQRINKEQELIEMANNIQKDIGETFVKFPFDFVMGQRVQEFHKLMKMFVNELHSKLARLQQFELDMRNWNTLFQMSELKKILVKEFAQGGVRPILNQGSKIVPKNVKEDVQDQAPSLNCKFIM